MPPAEALYLPFLDAAVMVAAVIAYTRVAGLRSFSKMSGYDFAITVSMGSVVASVVVTKDTGPLVGLAALGALFVVQGILSLARTRWNAAGDAMDNTPLLIMDGPTILDDNLRTAKMTRGDLIAKLREANVLQLSEVRAVVFEQTGDVSVLHGNCDVDDQLLDGVRRHP